MILVLTGGCDSNSDSFSNTRPTLTVNRNHFTDGGSFALKAQLHGPANVRVYEGLAQSLEINFRLLIGDVSIDDGISITSSPVVAGVIRDLRIDAVTEFTIPVKIYSSKDRRSINLELPTYQTKITIDRDKLRKSDGLRIYGYWRPIHPGSVDPLDDETNIVTLPPKSFEAFGL